MNAPLLPLMPPLRVAKKARTNKTRNDGKNNAKTCKLATKQTKTQAGVSSHGAYASGAWLWRLLWRLA
jgi:hypothetical protein